MEHGSKEQLTFSSLVNGLQFTKIETLKLTHIIQIAEDANTLDPNFFKFLNLSKIRKISLNRNNIVALDGVLPISLKHLEILDLSYNRLTNIGTLVWNISQLRQIRYVDFSHQSRRYLESDLNFLTDDKEVHFLPRSGFNWSSCVSPELKINCNFKDPASLTTSWCIPVSRSLKIVNMSESMNVELKTMPVILFLGNFNVRELKFSRNGLTSLVNPIIIDRPNSSIPLTLDVSKNDLGCIAKDVLNISISRGLNLGKLVLSKNDLSDQLQHDVKGETFENYKQLTNLQLANNKLKFLPRDIFKHLHNLQILNLSTNFLQSLDLNFDALVRLKQLNLDFNLLTDFDKAVRAGLDDLSRRTNYSINLFENPLKCSCETLQFLHWLESNNFRIAKFEETTCLFKGDLKSPDSLKKSILPTLDLECSSSFALKLSLASFSLTLFGVILSVFLYRHRWDLKYYFIKLSQKGHKYQLLLEQQSVYQYDAFVAYDHRDRSVGL